MTTRVRARGRRPTIQDVAQKAGVSAATVSIVLGGGDAARRRASAETREKIRAAATSLGYVPNQAARGLRVGSPETLALLLRWPDSPWTQGILRDVTEVATEHGYTTVLLSSGDGLSFIERGSADAAIMDSSQLTEADLPRVRALIERGVALTVFSNTFEPDGFDVVRTNERAACHDAVQRLVAAGHTRIACLNRDPGATTTAPDDRFLAYLDVLEQSGLPHDPALVRDVGPSRELAFRATRELLALPDPPTAVFAGSDLAAISAVWAALSLQRRVPEDVTVTGVGNSLEGTLIQPRLTTVGPGSRDYRHIAQRLFERLGSRTRLADEVVQEHWTVIPRES